MAAGQQTAGPARPGRDAEFASARTRRATYYEPAYVGRRTLTFWRRPDPPRLPAASVCRLSQSAPR